MWGAREATNDVRVWRIRIARWISKTTRTRMHIPTIPSTHTHARKRTHTHTKTYNTYCFSTAIILKRASILRHTYIPRFVYTDIILFDNNMCSVLHAPLSVATNTVQRTTGPKPFFSKAQQERAHTKQFYELFTECF